MQIRHVAVAALVVIGAVLVAFFLSFNSLFSDGPSAWLDPERLVLFALIFVSHGLLAAAGSRWAGSLWWIWALVVAAPSAIISLLYAAKETNVLPLALFGVLLAFSGSTLGAFLGRNRPQ